MSCARQIDALFLAAHQNNFSGIGKRCYITPASNYSPYPAVLSACVLPLNTNLVIVLLWITNHEVDDNSETCGYE